MPPVTLSPVLTPSGHLLLAPSPDAPPLPDPLQRQFQDSFARAPGHGLLHLGLREVGNRLSDLWSIFDFTHSGLLGSDKAFSAYAKRLSKDGNFGPLRDLVRPYILRRLKTDKTVIADLPDKTEMKAFCHLSPPQAALYQRAVEELAEVLDKAEGMGRKGTVLSDLMRFKQICNHPSQWLGDASWAEGDSGKFARLRELAEVIAAKQEKMLVFTQFQEATSPIATYLGNVFGREGLVSDKQLLDLVALDIHSARADT